MDDYDSFFSTLEAFMSIRIKFISFCLVFGVLFSLSLATAADGEYSELSGTVANVSKYGNLEMDTDPAALHEAGYEFGDVLNVTVGGTEIEAPFCTSYSDVDTGSPLVRHDEEGNVLIVAINMGDFSSEYGVEEGDTVTFSMEEKAGYRSEYLLRQLERSNKRANYASDSIFANFRNMPQGDIAQGVIYRSSSPINNELGRAAYADELTEAFDINTVINMADSKEEIEGFLKADGPDSPYYESLYENGKVKYLNMGVDLTSESFGENFAEGLRYMIDHEGPYLIHCTEGKDRAGFAAAVIEALMGASPVEVVRDYMRTYENYYGVERGTEQYNAIAESNIVTSMSTIVLGEEDALTREEAAELTGEDLAQAAASYLREIGLSGSEISALKEQLSTAPEEDAATLSGTVREIEKYGHTSTDIPIEEFFNEGFELGDMVTVTYENGYTLEAPFLDGYYVEQGDPLVRAYPGHEYIAVCINYGKIFKVANAEKGDSLTITLSEEEGYLDEYSVRSLERSNKREDYSSDKVFANFRTITEGDIDSGILYRSSSPINPELGRASYADDLIEKNDIATVVNLADSAEQAEKYMASEEAESPYYTSLYEDGQVITLNMDMTFTGEQFQSDVARGMSFMVNHEPPYLFHCTEGKDRAGFVGAMLEALMGATIEEIEADYMTSFTNYYDVKPGTEKYQIIAKDVRNMLTAIAGTEDLSEVDLSAAVETYLTEGGMSSAEVQELKAVLSGEPAAEAAAAEQAETTEYTVKSGDTLWDLSAEYLGTGFRYEEIYEANEDIIDDPDLIYVGQDLTIPAE
jgi:protein tyrosine/serine phosphatase/LysM repeat protein